MVNPSTFKNDPNPFELLGIEPTFEVDLGALDTAYFSRQALAHPDRFIDHSGPEREAATAYAASLNQAYEVIKNPVSRAKALLTLRGIEAEGGMEQCFLDETLALWETMNEAVFLSDLEFLEKDVQGRLQDIMASFAQAIAQGHDQGLRELFLRLNYLSKLVEDIKARQWRFS